MSSAEEEFSDGEGAYKKRRVSRACDICRRKKGDGIQGPGKKCSNCTAFKLKCSYVEAAKAGRPPPKALVPRVSSIEPASHTCCRYVAGLEERLKNMEDLLQRAGRGTSSANGSAHTDSPSSVSDNQGSSPPTIAPRPRFSTHLIDDMQSSDDEDVLLSKVRKNFDSLTMSDRFFGKSSAPSLMKTAMELKQEWTTGDEIVSPALPRRRPEFWIPQPWQINIGSMIPDLIFPDPKLLQSLIDLYFERRNPFQPLLHRPTFEKDLTQGLHLRSPSFANVVMGMCACAARFSDDPRVLLDGSESLHSAGWKYYNQMRTDRNSVLSTPNIHDLQSYCLQVMFLQGSSTPQSAWILAATGLRLAQDMGAHRRKAYGRNPTVHGELLKRAFWILVWIDRLLSVTLGRSCVMQEEDFDVELPVDCDDEYWIMPESSDDFKQPPGKPSTISYFICGMKLTKILAFATRSIYSTNKSKFFLGLVGPDWEQNVTVELDSMLNTWLDSVPDHMRWDPAQEDYILLSQAASLSALYYFTQITVHRPFMTRADKTTHLTFPSMAICTNAARSSARIAETLMRRSDRRGIPASLVETHSLLPGLIIMLNIWQAKRFSISVDAEREMKLVKVWLDMAKALETRQVSQFYVPVAGLAFMQDVHGRPTVVCHLFKTQILVSNWTIGMHCTSCRTSETYRWLVFLISV
ncbi:fungal-specific transcription factor domain-containing protein [Vararia minispora EC-137]|uniref:Fungal-specific transcription factor domain-containing protein n=1 Tax=Vararia minispora EC-137 TaxID=1314806 RepID=A0ACB8Q7M1_9AGAM|nr:fungal-specific transcription factor domain-containing protein [Vararia minispora EC-137]